jgi:hypothetical protein
MLVQPLGILPIKSTYMLRIFTAQVAQSTVKLPIVSAIGAFHRASRQAKQVLMRVAMLLQPRKSVPPQQALLAAEMHVGKFYEPGNLTVQLNGTAAVRQLIAQPAQRVHQDFVLIIHRRDPNRGDRLTRGSTHKSSPIAP